MGELVATPCQKCRSADVWMHYQAEAHASCPRWPYQDGEHMDFGCRRCQFSWTGPIVPSDARLEELEG